MSSSILHSVTRLLRLLGQAIEALFAMSGIFLTRLDGPRGFATAVTAGTTVLVVAARFVPTFNQTVSAFVVAFLIRYAFLFLSFVPGGFADRLKRRCGAARGFALYEALTAIMFHARGLTFAWLVAATQRSLEGTVAPWLRGAGLALMVAGGLINLWSTLVIGLPTYFYRDLFLAEPEVAFKVEGPYRWFRNPMYGLGQGAAYGAALMSLSPAGVLATALNQASMYLFNWRIEQPHLVRASRGAPVATRASCPTREI
jgi:protein-S-isoprenylcysteine O-methyltransferase Ste14